jgi:hypothetical protein
VGGRAVNRIFKKGGIKCIMFLHPGYKAREKERQRRGQRVEEGGARKGRKVRKEEKKEGRKKRIKHSNKKESGESRIGLMSSSYD